MKRYGLIVADNGSNWYFTGTVDGRWTGDQVNELKQIPANAVPGRRRVLPQGERRLGPGLPARFARVRRPLRRMTVKGARERTDGLRSATPVSC